ncbi:MAG: tRNA threonylcarbamoyladenosine dehydratase [Lachnospiraceae bacterium]
MEQNQYTRTALLMGEENLAKLHGSRVAVFGVGGVGGYVVEALARSGVGTLDLIDNDVVSLSNLNRQIIALHSTLGQYKVDVAAERIHDIDPQIRVNTYKCFYLPEKRGNFDFTQWDYIVDAVDTVTAKIDIIAEAARCHVPIISACGCGNRMDPARLTVTDLYKTVNDPLAKVLRRECRRRGIKKLTVVCSTEPAIKPLTDGNAETDEKGTQEKGKKRFVPGSTAFVPAAAGLLAASRVIRDLTGFDGSERTKAALKGKSEQETT